MNITRDEWTQIAELSGPALKARIFELLQEASHAFHTDAFNTPETLEVIPRLAEIVPKRPELASYREPLSALARLSGLWNYIDKEAATEADVLLAESVTLPELDGVTLHREQVEALNDLLAGRNLILSAPTSFGKSLLIDALLASSKYRRVAIVLPTIALLDEFRRRLRRRFPDRFAVVMHPSDSADEDTPTIFLGTQERLIHRTDLGTLDLTVVDEFYKLDPTRKDERSVTLNAAVYKLLNRSKQFFFLGPNIDGVRFDQGGRWKFEFLRTRFSTVAVDTYDLRKVAEKEARLLEEVGEEANWPALVFLSSPDRANRMASRAAEEMAVSDTASPFAEWLRANVGEKWSVVNSVRYGFGVHHGRLPRAIASHMVRLFNEGTLPVLFCTSTLIEGVNTAAKTVFIYDKDINKAPYDFFTYSNIKGRAGRLGQHHVGRVYLFNEAPDQEEMEVAPTLFADEDTAPLDYVVQLDDQPTRRSPDTRVTAIKATLGLEGEDVRLAASVGLENAAILKSAVEKSQSASLQWTGFPRYEQIAAVVSLICGVRRASEFGAFTDKMLTYQINALRQAPSMQAFLTKYDATYRGTADAYDHVFRFLRACEYGLPQWFALVQAFVRGSGGHADYSLFIVEMSRWFKAEALKDLDEEGIPIQVSERFHGGETKIELTAKLAELARSRSAELTPFERQWVLSALELGQGT
ncbi:DEAD/DEAH box helicase [Pseudomarimonas salicorniae]|uniref:DEAD/DEAH box helicase n=1 Tax=Pseudomarimonas salicorniae TaxID=2933270 RepID=A0ABT0GGP2_9GAMM|nr:DEAD/DEAH box helicase [Lysobacter sp. CAU 1642]MCK7593708.1 DEAD/DEAH box helicase [Lysobacter sp. CAU 1642]